jgi:hypothetical protein
VINAPRARFAVVDALRQNPHLRLTKVVYLDERVAPGDIIKGQGPSIVGYLAQDEVLMHPDTAAEWAPEQPDEEPVASWSKFTEDMAYDAYTALVDTVGTWAAEDSSVTPVEALEPFMAALQQVPASHLAARYGREQGEKAPCTESDN